MDLTLARVREIIDSSTGHDEYSHNSLTKRPFEKQIQVGIGSITTTARKSACQCAVLHHDQIIPNKQLDSDKGKGSESVFERHGEQ
jgi:hypothetical protein